MWVGEAFALTLIMASKVSQTKRDCPFYIAIATLTVEIRGRGAEELIVKI